MNNEDLKQSEEKIFEERFIEETGEKFDNFYAKYRPKLVWFLMNMCKDKSNAEEIADEAILKSIDEFSKFDGSKGQYSTWLFTIARRILFHKYKESKKFQSLEEDHDGAKRVDFLSSDQTDPYIYENMLKKKSDLVKNKIPQLPIKYATVLTMREIDGQSYESISNYLDLNLSTIKSQIRQGRILLRKMCQKEFDMIELYG